MAANTTTTIPAATWTMITASDVTAVSVQNQSVRVIHLKATVGTTAPTDTLGSRIIPPYGSFTAQYLLSEIFPGVAGANRVWAYADAAANLAYSHA